MTGMWLLLVYVVSLAPALVLLALTAWLGWTEATVLMVQEDQR